MTGKITGLDDSMVTVECEGTRRTYPRTCIRYDTPEQGDRIILMKNAEDVELFF